MEEAPTTSVEKGTASALWCRLPSELVEGLCKKRLVTIGSGTTPGFVGPDVVLEVAKTTGGIGSSPFSSTGSGFCGGSQDPPVKAKSRYRRKAASMDAKWS